MIYYHLVFFHYLIHRGLKLRAFNFFLKIKYGLKIAEDFDVSFTFLISLLNVTPSLTTRIFRRGSNLIEIPLPATYWKKIILSCSWVVKLSKKVNGFFGVDEIVETLVSSIYNTGSAIRKRDEIYSTAVVNSHLLNNRFFFR